MLSSRFQILKAKAVMKKPSSKAMMKKPAATKTEADYLTIDLTVINKTAKEKHSGEVTVVKNETMKELLMAHLMDEYDWEDDIEMTATLDVAAQCTTYIVDGKEVNAEKKIGEVCVNGSKVKMKTAKFKMPLDEEADAPAPARLETEATHGMMPPTKAHK